MRFSKTFTLAGENMDPAGENRSEGKKFRTMNSKIIAVAIALIIIASGFTVYYAVTGYRNSNKSITVYTYSTFMAYGSNETNARNAVFHNFETNYGVTVNVKYLTTGLLQTLNASKGHQTADIVIGLTNMNGVQAVKDGLLVKYTPPGASDINTSLKTEMGSASPYITPYEYSYLGLDYNKSYFGTGNLTPEFSTLANGTYAKNLLLQYPSQSNTGEGFLLWEIAYYKYVLGQNWTTWWLNVKTNVTGHIYDSWASSFNQFETGPNTNMVVSYLTDTAYNSYFGYGNSTGSAVTYHNSKAYGWRTIYGIGIVNGSSNIGLDREFINYFLSPTVQNEIPQNEWMYPSNGTIVLPASFGTIQNQNSIYALNNYINATEINRNIQNWEIEWLNIMA